MKKILLVVSITGFMFAEVRLVELPILISSAQMIPLPLISRGNISGTAEIFRIRLVLKYYLMWGEQKLVQ